VRGSVKYSNSGGCTTELLSGLDLPEETLNSLAALGNLGITKSTWSTYKTAKTMVERCEHETKTDLSLPFDQKKALVFIDWLARVRKLKGSTINSYLAGIRQTHVVRNIEPPMIHSALVKLVLRGIENRDGIAKRRDGVSGRLPMTINTMRIFKNVLASSHLNNSDQRLIWAVATMAFAGAFRIGELLSTHESTYDPDFTLLKRDVSVSTTSDGTKTIHVTLKCPKEAKNAAPTVVDLFQNNGYICPVKAYLTWLKLQPREDDLPLFRFSNGTPLTGAKMNRLMRLLLDPYTDMSIGHFSGHSFRIGLASMLANLGLPDEELQAAGRWSSRAFEIYMKLKRTKRTAVATKIQQLTK